VIASDRRCPPAPPQNLHGKEGVDGSSPSEGLYEMPANGDFMLPVVTRFRFFAGTRRVHFGTGGHPRARATPRDTAWDVLETLDRDHLLEKFLQNRLGGVAHTDATLTPSFAREGAYGFDWCDTTSANPDAPPNCGTRSGQQSVPRLP
jgi:hypothetical protein